MAKGYLIAAASALSLINPKAEAQSCNQVNLFSFGSSWTDYSFNRNGRQPSPQYPLGNPDFGATNNAQHGANYVQYLTVKDFQVSPTLSYDLAKAGSCIDSTIGIPGCATQPDLVNQTTLIYDGQYAQGQSKAPTCGSNIFIVWMGDNDVFNGKDNSNIATLTSKLMDRYFALMEDLVSHGATQFFFVTVPAQDRSPRVLGLSSAERLAYLKMKWGYNAALETRINAFQAKHPTISSQLFNSTNWLNEHLDNPMQYGFTDNTCIDYSSASTCMWADNFHLTTAVHKLMAQAMIPKLDLVGFKGPTSNTITKKKRYPGKIA